MSGTNGPGSDLWRQLQQVRVTKGKIEAPVRADGKNGIQVGDFSLPKPSPAGERRPGLLARLFRRRQG